MSATETVEVAVIGAGIAGLAVGYYLSQRRSVRLIDPRQPMSFTSAQSGDNYRNWWPHPLMKAFSEDSIRLLRKIAGQSENRINMNQGGYLLATRKADIDHLLRPLRRGFTAEGPAGIRIHNCSGADYRSSLQQPGSGVDILSNKTIIRSLYPHLAPDIRHLLHIRDAGDISSQQLGQYMLETIRRRGGRLIAEKVSDISAKQGFHIHLQSGDQLWAEKLVIAAGPFVNQLLEHLDESLPVVNILQQKLAFADVLGAVPRSQPFCVDLDSQRLDWSSEEQELIGSDGQLRWLTQELPGGIHCRPQGGSKGTWIKLGWALNRTATKAVWEPTLDDWFPEIVLRGASRLNPALKGYYERLPAKRSHYGGYYTMTAENWPLIGPLKTPGAYVIAALSGFGSMCACAAGALCAKWVEEQALPEYALPLSMQRYRNQGLMDELSGLDDRGIL